MQHNEGDALSAGEISTVEGLAAAISARKNNDRFMVAVAGPPGSGKTTTVSYTHLTLPTTPYV